MLVVYELVSITLLRKYIQPEIPLIIDTKFAVHKSASLK